MTGPLSRDEEQELAKRIQDGDTDARDRLVEANLGFVVSFVDKYKGQGIDFEDLVSYGNVGLIKAANRFEPGHGKFITYAKHWIKQTVMKAIRSHADPVRPPERSGEESEGVSLDKPVGEGDITVEDVLPSGAYQQNERTREEKSTREVLSDTLDKLKPSEQKIIVLYYGLDGGEEMNLNQISNCLGYSKEWVNQLRNRAIEKLQRLTPEGLNAYS